MRIVLEACDKSGAPVGKINLGDFWKSETPRAIKYEIKRGIREAYSSRPWSERPFKYIIKLYNKHTRKRTILGYAYKNEHFYSMDTDIFLDMIAERFTGKED